MRISDWSSDVCSSDLPAEAGADEREIRPLALWPHRLRRAGARHRQFGDIGALRDARAEETLSGAAAGERDRLLLLHDGAAGRGGPAGHAHGRDAGGWRMRSEERRVGKEGVSTCRSRRSPDTSKTKK